MDSPLPLWNERRTQRFMEKFQCGQSRVHWDDEPLSSTETKIKIKLEIQKRFMGSSPASQGVLDGRLVFLAGVLIGSA